MIKPLLSAETHPRQHELTTLLNATLEGRDGYATLYAWADADWTHNQLFKKKLSPIRFGDEVIIGAKFDKRKEVTAVASLTETRDGFPTLDSRVKLRDFVTGIDHDFVIDEYLRKGPARPYKFVPVPPPTPIK